MEVDLKQVQARLVRRHPLWAEWVARWRGLRLMRWLDAEESSLLPSLWHSAAEQHPSHRPA
jgi:hypothetical protein